MLTPWIIRNYQVAGAFVPTRTTGAAALWLGANENSADLNSLALCSYANSGPLPVKEIVAENREVEVARVFSQRARAFIIENPLIWLRASLRRVAYFFQPYNFLEYFSGRGVRLGLWFLMCVGLAAAPWRNPKLYAYLSPVFAYTATVFLVGGELLPRLRAMMAPGESLLIANGLMASMYCLYRVLRGGKPTTTALAPCAMCLAGIAAISGLALAAPRIAAGGRPVATWDMGTPPEGFAVTFLNADPVRGGVLFGETETGDTVLLFDGSSKPHQRKGIRLSRDSESLEASGEYTLTLDVWLKPGSLITATVMAYKGDRFVARRESQVLAEVDFRSDVVWGRWTTLYLPITAPYQPGYSLAFRVVLGSLNMPLERGLLDFEGTAALVNHIQLRRSNVLRRYIGEYFGEGTGRRDMSFYRNYFIGPSKATDEPIPLISNKRPSSSN